jgi:hypothetical protein
MSVVDNYRLKRLKRALRRRAADGELLDLTVPARDVPAELLCDMVTGKGESAPARAVNLRGARVIGPLNLGSVELRCPLRLERCEFREHITLSEAKAPAIRLIACRIASMTADQLETRGDLELTDSTVTGEVRLVGAHIGGNLSFKDARLTNPEHSALHAAALTVDQNMNCDGLQTQGELHLVGAHVAGVLKLDGAALANERTNASETREQEDSRKALFADGLRVDGGMFGREGFNAKGEVKLIGAHIGGNLEFNGARLSSKTGKALYADRLTVDQGLGCGEGFCAEGEVSLIGARIDGEFNLAGATLDGGLRADALTVKQGMFCRAERPEQGGRRFRATGGVRLLAANIAGQLNFNGAELTKPPKDGMSLNAAGLTVDGDMFCEGGFHAQGSVFLVRAHVKGTLSLHGAKLDGPAGALSANGLIVDGDMSCKDADITGRVSLVGAHIAGQFDFQDAKLSGAPLALDLEEARARNLVLRLATMPSGEVNLTAARLRSLSYDADGSWPRCRLSRCQYETLRASPEPGVKERLDWLASDPDAYAPQPYDQLAAAYRSDGNEPEARQVAIEKQRQRRRALPWWQPARAWSLIFGATVAHGYRLWQAGLWLLLLVVVGSVLFGAVYCTAGEESCGAADLTPAKQRVEDVAPFNPVIYSVDLLIPVISLGQRTGWNAHSDAAQWAALTFTLLGWLLTAAFVAGLAARRQ